MTEQSTETETPREPVDTTLVRIYHPELDAYGESTRAGLKFLAGWEEVAPEVAEAAERTEYDPADHNADEVVAYLETASEVERAAVIALEQNGKNRKTVVEWTAPEGGTDG